MSKVHKSVHELFIFVKPSTAIFWFLKKPLGNDIYFWKRPLLVPQNYKSFSKYQLVALLLVVEGKIWVFIQFLKEVKKVKNNDGQHSDIFWSTRDFKQSYTFPP